MDLKNICKVNIYSRNANTAGNLKSIPDICTMKILLTAATQREIAPAIDFFERSSAGMGEEKVSWLITGIGLLSTTYSLMRQIRDRRPGCIIQAGIAGTFRKGLMGQLMAIGEDTPADIGVYEDNQYKSLFDLQLADANGYPFTNGFLVNPSKHLLTLSRLEIVRGITVNEITTDKRRMEEYNQKLLPVVESMEGAACHFVCLCEKIPFLQIRSISNQVGERDKSKWNIREAVGNLNDKLISLVPELIQNYQTHVDETISRI
jgi:futalosine hydrolase